MQDGRQAVIQRVACQTQVQWRACYLSHVLTGLPLNICLQLPAQPRQGALEIWKGLSYHLCTLHVDCFPGSKTGYCKRHRQAVIPMCSDLTASCASLTLDGKAIRRFLDCCP